MQKIDFIIERSILKIGNQLANIRDKDLKNLGLTPFQSEALLFFCSNEGVKILNLKEHFKITHQAARNLVERIRQKGYIRIEASNSDARAKSIFLTDSGREICVHLKKRVDYFGKNLLSQLSYSEKENLLGYLDKIIENL